MKLEAIVVRILDSFFEASSSEDDQPTVVWQARNLARKPQWVHHHKKPQTTDEGITRKFRRRKKRDLKQKNGLIKI